MRNLFARLNGWQRVKLVLSVIWLIAGFFYLRYVQIQEGLNFANLEFDVCIRSDTISNCLKSVNFAKPYVINWEEIFVYIFLPVPLAWFSVYLFNRIVLWIRDGFSTH